MKNNETASYADGRAFSSGLKCDDAAVLILIFAWALTDLIEKLETGHYLSELVMNQNTGFVLAGYYVYTCWHYGIFNRDFMGIIRYTYYRLLGTIMIDAAPEMLLPALAAVLAGAVFGDHCSPISDTTILSSTGAGCNHMDHVSTQLPYAFISAMVAII